MIYCLELKKSFATKKELFTALKENKDEIIALKKKQIQKSCKKGVAVTAKSIPGNKISLIDKSIVLDDNHYYIVTNTSKILDSHKDLHLDGLWDATVEARQGKNYLALDHSLSVPNIVARKESITMMTATIPFSLLGKNYDGDTYALIYKVPKDKVKNSIAKEWLESGDEIQASVRMQYVKITFAFDTDDPEEKAYKDEFDDKYPLIANKDDFEDEILYFWPVYEAKNVDESSLVIKASNSVTGLLQEQQKEAAEQAPQKKEPVEETVSKKSIDFYLNT